MIITLLTKPFLYSGFPSIILIFWILINKQETHALHFLQSALPSQDQEVRSHLVLTISTGIDAAVVTRPLIILAQK